MEQMEFDVRLESDRELEENVNVALDFACKQVRANSRAKVQNRHDGYGIASEFYANMKTGTKKVDESIRRWEKARRMVPRKIQRKMGLVLWPIPENGRREKEDRGQHRSQEETGQKAQDEKS